MQSEFVKLCCQQCAGWIEFPKDGIGETIKCPHCNNELLLTEPLAFHWVAPKIRNIRFPKLTWQSGLVLSSLVLSVAAWLIYSDFKTEMRKRTEALLEDQKTHNEEMERLQREQLSALQDAAQEQKSARLSAEQQKRWDTLTASSEKIDADYDKRQRDWAQWRLQNSIDEANRLRDDANSINQRKLWEMQRRKP